MTLAWRLHEVGSIGGLRLDRVDRPQIGEQDALVRIRAIGLNSSELQIVTGFWEGKGIHAQRKLPFVLGLEGVGEVLEVGRKVRDRLPGERVAIHYLWSCGGCEDCRSGWENTCPHAVHFGRTASGSYAEMARVPAGFLLPIPDEVTFEAAATLLSAGGTAWHMLMIVGGLTADETLLITGGSSGIGSAAVQIARMAGAQVIATAGSPSKVERLRKLGVDHAIDHSAAPDFSEQVLDLTSGRGVDIAYDAVGGAAFNSALRSLRRRGRLIVGGYMGGAEVALPLVTLTGTEVKILGSSSWTRRTARGVLSLAARGRLTSVVDSCFPFEQLPQGLERLRSRQVFGKVLVAGAEQAGAPGTA